jgi:maleate isomerase
LVCNQGSIGGKKLTGTSLIQAGTNLFCARVAAELEAELGKPVIAINTATVWHTYRTHGIADQMKGFGCLLEKY